MLGWSRCAFGPEAHFNDVTVRAVFFSCRAYSTSAGVTFSSIDSGLFNSRLRRHLRHHTGDSRNCLKKNLNACLSDRGEIVKTFKWEGRLQRQKGHLRVHYTRLFPDPRFLLFVLQNIAGYKNAVECLLQ